MKRGVSIKDCMRLEVSQGFVPAASVAVVQHLAVRSGFRNSLLHQGAVDLETRFYGSPVLYTSHDIHSILHTWNRTGPDCVQVRYGKGSQHCKAQNVLDVFNNQLKSV